MKRIYPAGPFSWQKRILDYAKQLENLGYTITGEWLHQVPQFTTPDNKTIITAGIHAECQKLSERDISNIAAADTLLLFEPGIPLERNTRVAEFGLALGWGKQCIVIGPEEDDKKDVISNIFVHLRKIPAEWGYSDCPFTLQRIKPVIYYQRWQEFLTDILNPEKVECCAGCGEEYRRRDCGCPAGSFYKWKTRVTNFDVLLPPERIRGSVALASV